MVLIDKAFQAKSKSAQDLLWKGADWATGWILAPTDDDTLEAVLVLLRKVVDAAEILEPIEVTGSIGSGS